MVLSVPQANGSLSPFADIVSQCIDTNCYISVCAMSLEHACTCMCTDDQTTYLRLGSEGMPLEKGRGDGVGGGVEVLCGS